ncbi:unnamed protein product [Fraxinus pennsylvanica]|uniref:RNase H type-1 domain-containing protein n=1 Tax=Fraxinus pennsylvanica TaxID=56036 RepID=A0AAD2A8Q2_9LAMI|nr:unnamed protein product [Fraxinus pennsylvanica]
MISWKKPLEKEYKLNVDGASKGNPGLVGGGGVLRDSNGTFLAGFSHHYSPCTNMVAETRALLDGLCMCRDLGVQLVFREANMAADFLAKMASDGSSIDFLYGDEVPTTLRGILRTDRWKLPYLRR